MSILICSYTQKHKEQPNVNKLAYRFKVIFHVCSRHSACFRYLFFVKGCHIVNVFDMIKETACK